MSKAASVMAAATGGEITGRIDAWNVEAGARDAVLTIRVGALFGAGYQFVLRSLQIVCRHTRWHFSSGARHSDRTPIHIPAAALHPCGVVNRPAVVRAAGANLTVPGGCRSLDR